MKDNKHIGLVLSFVPGYSETFFKNKIRGLINQGYRVSLLVDYKPLHPINTDYKVVVAPNFHGSAIRTIYSVLTTIVRTFLLNPKRSFRLYRLNKMDGRGMTSAFKNVLVNVHILERDFSWLHFGFGTLASGNENVAEAISAKMGVSFRGFDLYLSPLKHAGCFDNLFKKEVKYHVLSEEMKRDLAAFDIPENNIQVITPAIDTEFFKELKVKREWQKLKLLTVARLHWKKGLVYTLEALSILWKKGIDFEYTIVGEGNEMERLIFAAHQLGIKEKVNFLGKLSPEAVRNEMNNADIYLQYSIQEGFCNSVLEAQAMGLLCLVSDAEGLSENVLNEETGWVVTKRQPKLLAGKIMEVISLSAQTKENVRKKASDRVQRRFNLVKQQKEFVDFFE